MWDLIVSVPDHCLSFYLAVYGIAKNCFLRKIVYTALKRNVP